MKNKKVPQYPVNNQNMEALLDFYFSYMKTGSVEKLIKELNRYGFHLKELEDIAEKIYPKIETIWKELEKKPTQTIILEFAIETFYKVELYDLESSIERKGIINLLRNELHIDKPIELIPKAEQLDEMTKYYSGDRPEEVFDYKHLDLEYPMDEDDDFRDSDWSSSPYYDPRLEWNEQSDEFYNDVF